MTESGNDLSISLIDVSPRILIANFKEYFKVNASAIILNNFIIVIDTLLFPRQSKEFREQLEKKYELPVKYLFITHCHSDHYFGIASFKDVEFIGSSILIESLNRRKKENWTEEAFKEWKESEPEYAEYINEIEILIPIKGFDEKFVLADNDLYVEFYVSGGHTGCSSYAYFPEEKVVFTGDLVAVGFWPFISDPTEDFEGWIKSFEHILKLEIEKVVPGHGSLTDKEYIKEQLEFMKKLKKNVLRAISKGKSAEDIEVPCYEFQPAEDWQIPRALEFLYNFYSKKK
jgi:glyoxylase-like metal-dependent hydrolase (beta-lactamase superfamily II)